jgi:hypothetical protein
VAKHIEDQQIVKSRSPKARIEDFQALTKGKNTPFPKDDARPNPYLALDYEDLNQKLVCTKTIRAHEKGIAGMALHLKK